MEIARLSVWVSCIFFFNDIDGVYINIVDNTKHIFIITVLFFRICELFFPKRVASHHSFAFHYCRQGWQLNPSMLVSEQSLLLGYQPPGTTHIDITKPMLKVSDPPFPGPTFTSLPLSLAVAASRHILLEIYCLAW